LTLEETLLFLPGLLAGITVHECAHAWSASRLGDEFSRRQGRVSLNPLRHLSPLGTICMFLLPFGWGKPVYINLYNFSRPRRDYFLSSLAGPVAHLVMVALCLGLMQITRRSFAFGPRAVTPLITVHAVLLLAAVANTILAAFNLVPIPPLDGSKVWPCLFRKVKPVFSPALRQVSWIILLVIVFTRALSPAIQGVVSAVAKVMPASDVQFFDEQFKTALLERKAGHHAEAEKSLDVAIAINPQSVDCFELRAEQRAAQQKWAAADEDIRRAIELSKDDVAFSYFRAQMKSFQAQIEQHLPQAPK